MNILRRFLIFLCIFVLAAVAAMAQSRPAKPLATNWDRRDLNGVWKTETSNDISEHLLPGQEISFTPYGARRYRGVDHSQDLSNTCKPVGFFRGMQTPFMPFEIVQNSKRIAIPIEYTYTFRLIYTDGSRHPEDIYDYPEWMGHSVGTWEADTLVVDTIGFNDKTWLDTPGLEHSDKLHLTERFQKTSPETIKWTVTVDDPVFFTKPFTYGFEFKRQDTRIMSYSCAENEQDSAHMKPVLGGDHKNKSALKFPR